MSKSHSSIVGTRQGPSQTCVARHDSGRRLRLCHDKVYPCQRFFFFLSIRYNNAAFVDRETMLCVCVSQVSTQSWRFVTRTQTRSVAPLHCTQQNKQSNWALHLRARHPSTSCPCRMITLYESLCFVFPYLLFYTYIYRPILVHVHVTPCPIFLFIHFFVYGPLCRMPPLYLNSSYSAIHPSINGADSTQYILSPFPLWKKE